MPPNEAFPRVEIDRLLKDAAWNLTDGHSVRYEYRLSGGTRADYVLCDRHGRPMAVIEAKRSTLNPADAAAQGRAYVDHLDVPRKGDPVLGFQDRSTPALGQDLLQAG